jgi:hypothetical protein
MKYKTPVKITPEQEYAYREEQWQKVVKNPLAFDPAIIAERMEWFNMHDNLKINIALADYLEHRKKYLEDVKREPHE